jgi:hypothetical protein
MERDEDVSRRPRAWLISVYLTWEAPPNGTLVPTMALHHRVETVQRRGSACGFPFAKQDHQGTSLRAARDSLIAANMHSWPD